jgi:hypothetical protein
MSNVLVIGGHLVGSGGGICETAPGSSSYQIPLARTTTWMPGLSYAPTSGAFAPAVAPTGWAGGIPTSLYTQHGSTISPSGGDDASAINSALASAVSAASASNPLFVKLAVGSFLINSTNIQINGSYVELRGSGPGAGMTGALSTFPSGSTATVLTRQSGSSNSVITIGTIQNSGDAELGTITSTANISVDAVSGTNSTTIATGLSYSSGELVFIDELFDPTLIWFNEGAGQGAGFRGWGENGGASTDAASRPVGQALEVVNYNSSTGVITFNTPFAKTYRVAFTAHIITITPTPTRWSGVSNLFAGPAGGGDGGGAICMGTAMYCWIQGCEIAGHTNEFGGGLVHIFPSFRCEVRDSYLHSVNADVPNISPGGGYYNFVIDTFTSDCLVENNISWVANKVMVMRSAGSGNVIGYNYMDDGYGDGYVNQMETGLNQDHMAGTHHTLFEGNYSWQMGCDSRWGNQTFATFFRNWATGMRASAWPTLLIPAGSTAIGSPLIGLTNSNSQVYEDGFNRSPIQIGSFHWFYNYVGNVLGFTGNPLLTSPASSGSVVQTGTLYERFGPSTPTSLNNAIVPMITIGAPDGSEQSVAITGFIAGNILTVVSITTTAPDISLIEPGFGVSGSSVSANTQITGFNSSGISFGGTGTGMLGTYLVNNSQTVGSSGSPVAMTIGYFGNGLNQTVLPTTLRDANYDFFSGLVHWHGIGGTATNSSTGAGGTTPPGASATGGTTLPNSLYQASKPAFFHSNTWPCYDGSNSSNPLPGNQPAWARFRAGTPNSI